MSSEEQEKFKERQGVQFLYMKPPGADSMAASGPKVNGQERGIATPVLDGLPGSPRVFWV